MEIIIHRINKINELKEIPKMFGCEIDIRTNGSNLILNHEPFGKGDFLTDYLDNFNNGTLVLNIKESGIENYVLKEVRQRNIKSYFLLDIEFPYMYKASLNGEKNMAIRFSEKEAIENLRFFKNKINWVWIDTISKFPIKKNIVQELSEYKSCLVCPERWGRPMDIEVYKKKIINLEIKIDAVMTSKKFYKKWI